MYFAKMTLQVLPSPTISSSSSPLSHVFCILLSHQLNMRQHCQVHFTLWTVRRELQAAHIFFLFLPFPMAFVFWVCQNLCPKKSYCPRFIFSMDCLTHKPLPRIFLHFFILIYFILFFNLIFLFLGIVWIFSGALSKFKLSSELDWSALNLHRKTLVSLFKEYVKGCWGLLLMPMIIAHGCP